MKDELFDLEKEVKEEPFLQPGEDKDMKSRVSEEEEPKETPLNQEDQSSKGYPLLIQASKIYKKAIREIKKHPYFVIIFIAILLIFGILNPVFSGYSTAENKKSIDTLEGNINDVSENLEVIKEKLVTKAELEDQVQILNIENNKLKLEKQSIYERALSNELTFNSQIQQLRDKLKKNSKETKQEIDELKDQVRDQNRVIASSAIRICCRQRVDNLDINSYSISDNTIQCLQDGDEPLNCPG